MYKKTPFESSLKKKKKMEGENLPINNQFGETKWPSLCLLPLLEVPITEKRSKDFKTGHLFNRRHLRSIITSSTITSTEDQSKETRRKINLQGEVGCMLGRLYFKVIKQTRKVYKEYLEDLRMYLSEEIRKRRNTDAQTHRFTNATISEQNNEI